MQRLGVTFFNHLFVALHSLFSQLCQMIVRIDVPVFNQEKAFLLEINPVSVFKINRNPPPSVLPQPIQHINVTWQKPVWIPSHHPAFYGFSGVL